MKVSQKFVGFILLSLVLVFLGCAQPPVDPAQLMTEIEAANAKFMELFSAGDAAGLTALYTEDAMILPPNADFVKGTEAIQGFWQAVFDMGVASAKLKCVEVEGYGDTAIEVSQFKMLGPDEQVLDHGKYIVIWKNVDGEWKLHRDIFNSSKSL
jgi:uncharacterized protein (TIGR02246 family)